QCLHHAQPRISMTDGLWAICHGCTQTHNPARARSAQSAQIRGRSSASNAPLKPTPRHDPDPGDDAAEQGEAAGGEEGDAAVAEGPQLACDERAQDAAQAGRESIEQSLRVAVEAAREMLRKQLHR